MDDEKEEEEDDVVFSSRLKSVLLNAPKELSRAMFDFASSAKFALTTTTKTRTRRIIIESHDEEEEENEEEEEEERGGKGVTESSRCESGCNRLLRHRATTRRREERVRGFWNS